MQSYVKPKNVGFRLKCLLMRHTYFYMTFAPLIQAAIPLLVFPFSPPLTVHLSLLPSPSYLKQLRRSASLHTVCSLLTPKVDFELPSAERQE